MCSLPNDANADEQLFVYLKRRPLWRRVRSHEGKSWTIEPTSQETRDSGLLCSSTTFQSCHRRILYRKLEIQYEMQGTDVIRLWICECGNVLRTDNMTDLAMVYETRKGNYGRDTGKL